MNRRVIKSTQAKQPVTETQLSYLTRMKHIIVLTTTTATIHAIDDKNIVKWCRTGIADGVGIRRHGDQRSTSTKQQRKVVATSWSLSKYNVSWSCFK